MNCISFWKLSIRLAASTIMQQGQLFARTSHSHEGKHEGIFGCINEGHGREEQKLILNLYHLHSKLKTWYDSLSAEKLPASPILLTGFHIKCVSIWKVTFLYILLLNILEKNISRKNMIWRYHVEVKHGFLQCYHIGLCFNWKHLQKQ